MTDEPATHPRRLRFGLRSLFVLVMIVAIPCAWVAYSLNWIRERRQFLARDLVAYQIGSLIVSKWVTSQEDLKSIQELPSPTTAPNGLSLFGERGITTIIVDTLQNESDGRRLFPESEIFLLAPGEFELVFAR